MAFERPRSSGWVGLFVGGLSLVLASISAWGAAMENGRVRVETLQDEAPFGGLRLQALPEGPSHEVFLSLTGDLTASSCQVKEGRRMRLEGLQGRAPSPVTDGWIEVALLEGDPYPRIAFHLQGEAVDVEAWTRAYGEIPFHFLSCPLLGAEVFHQRGWPIGTPDYDPYPMRQAENFGKTIVSHFSRDWTNVVPLGAHPFPVVGLWKPSAGRYAGYDFHWSRLKGNRERDVCTSYCFALGEDRKEAFTLAYPHSKGYQKLVFPEEPFLLEGSFTFLYAAYPAKEGGAWDPNLFVTDWVWKTYGDLLPRTPQVNDLSWLPNNMRFDDFSLQGVGGLFGPETEPRWFLPGSIDGRGVGENYVGVDLMMERGRTEEIERFHRDIAWLRERAKRFEMNGDACCFWEKPIEGDGAEMFGPGVKSLHNVGGWGIALALLEAYRCQPEQCAEYLEDVDGALRWTKHLLYTRNCYPDVPAAEFAWSAGPATAFCLRYYFTFRDDPTRGELAELAYRLSRSMLYRYLAIWTSDSDIMDGDEPSFMMEPNAGQPWCACACANEIWVLPRALVRVYVSTGDPVLGYYLRGMMERFHEIVQNVKMSTLPEYAHDMYSERLGLYDGCAQGDGVRGDFGGLWGGSERICWPPGEATVRIVCGERTAFAFNKDGSHTVLASYKAGRDGAFGFQLKALQDEGRERTVCVTFPFLDLRGRPVSWLSSEGPVDLRKAGRVKEHDFAPESLTITNVPMETWVEVGKGEMEEVPLPDLKARSLREKKAFLCEPDFVALNVASCADHEVSVDWSANEGYGGLWTGKRWVGGVPFYLVDPELNRGLGAVSRNPVPVEKALAEERLRPPEAETKWLFALVAGEDEDNAGSLVVQYDKGRQEGVSCEDAVPFVVGWPECYTWHLDLVVHKLQRLPVRHVLPRGVTVFALTLCNAPEDQLEPILAAVRERVEEIRAEEAAAALMGRLEADLRRLSGHVAVLPVPGKDRVEKTKAYRRLMKRGLHVHLRILTPEELVQPGIFNAQSFPVALYLGSESYVHSVSKSGDGLDALRRYLSEGGTVVMLPRGPFPMYYAQTPGGKGVEGEPNGRGAGQVGWPVCGSGVRGAKDLLAGADVAGWEEPPEGASLFFVRNESVEAVQELPCRFPFPKEGDLRWRPTAHVNEQSDYEAWLSLVDEEGRPYGDGAARIQYQKGSLAPGRLLGGWHTLLNDAEMGPHLMVALLKEALRDVPPVPDDLSCLRASSRVVADGRLIDPAWGDAPVLEKFTCFLSREGEPPLSTTARLLWDEQGFFLGVVCWDPDIFCKERERDGFLWEDEVVELYIDPDGDGRNYYEFEVNPMNQVIDLKIESPEQVKTIAGIQEAAEWNAEGWRTGVALDGDLKDRANEDRLWTVESFLPWSALDGMESPKEDDVLRVQVYRIDRSKSLGETPLFVSLARTENFHRPEFFGRLHLLGNPFDEDFSMKRATAQPGGHWRVENGTWTIQSGALVGENAGGDGFIPVGLRSKARPLVHFKAIVEFKVLSAGSDHRDGCWIGFRDQGPKAGYGLHFARDKVRLMKRNQGAASDDENDLGRKPWSAGETWHRAEIIAAGTRIRVEVDGEKLFDVRDDRELGVGPIPYGDLVLSARRWTGGEGDTRVAFRKVKVERWSARR